MIKRLSRQQKIEKAVIDILNKMFEIAGHDVTYDDIKDRKDNWYQQWKMTYEQNEEWKLWGTQYFRKELRMNKRAAEIEMGWISLMWGLSISDWDDYINKNLDK